jgi:hypothetical protein
MELSYKSREIHTMVELNLKVDCWVPKAHIYWNEHGNLRHHELTGVSDRFKIIDDALVYAMEMAQAWIDADKQLSE